MVRAARERSEQERETPRPDATGLHLPAHVRKGLGGRGRSLRGHTGGCASGNQVRGEVVSRHVRPRHLHGEVFAAALVALGLLAGACGTTETVAGGGDPTGPVDGSGPDPPIMVELSPERVSLSADGGCWITDDGSAECWDDEDEWHQEGDFVQISAGTLFACGVTSDSRARCWSKEHGEGFFRPWPGAKEEIVLPESTPVKQVEVDGPHLCAVHSDGTLGCYGRKYYGDRPEVVGWEPPEPGPLPQEAFAQISTGAWRYGDSTGLSCGVRAGTGKLACWDYYGMRPRPEGEYSQVSVSHGLTSGELSVGGIPISYGVGALTCGVLVDGRAECWSMDGTDEDGARTAVRYYTPGGQFVQVSAGYEYVCGLRADGAVECWQLDRLELPPAEGANADFPPVVLDLPADSRFTRIAVGRHGRACGIRIDRELECWTITEIEPEQPRVVVDEEHRSSVVIAEDTADLIRVEGSGSSPLTIDIGAGTWVPVFSSDGEYELIVPGRHAVDLEKTCQPPFYGPLTGLAGGWTVREAPHLLTMAGERAEAGRGPAFVFGDDRGAMCEPGEYRVYVGTTDESTHWSLELRRAPGPGWGYGNAAALNKPDAEFLHIDAATRWVDDWPAEHGNATARVAGDSYLCGVLAAGGVRCWGTGYEGGTDPPPTRFVETSLAAAFACGLEPDGTMQCWDSDDRYSAGLSPQATGIVQIESSGAAVCAVLRSGDVACDYAFGAQPGAGFALEESWQHPVASVSLSESGFTDCVVWTDGEASCRDYFQLDQAPSHRFKRVSTSDRHACGILTDDAVRCWGFFSQEDRLHHDRRQHVLNAPDGEFAQVAAGDYHTCGLRVDGTAACWGWNRFGQSTPPGGRFTQIVSTMHMSCGLRPDGSVECWGYAGEQ